jgi:hypothetical protein
LKLENLLTKGFALFGVGNRLLDRCFSRSYGSNRNLQTLPRQFLHQIDEAVVLFTKQVRHRHFDIVEKQLASVLRFLSRFLERFALGESRH